MALGVTFAVFEERDAVFCDTLFASFFDQFLIHKQISNEMSIENFERHQSLLKKVSNELTGDSHERVLYALKFDYYDRENMHKMLLLINWIKRPMEGKLEQSNKIGAKKTKEDKNHENSTWKKDIQYKRMGFIMQIPRRRPLEYLASHTFARFH
uniref:Uncharacterized protein n=1 Tax=Romanomermis culicivorax TaxID=13658 RepID=A0A915K1Y3_ROMCU